MVNNEKRMLVYNILKDSEASRNSGKRFMYEVLCRTIPLFGLNVTFEEFSMAPSAETVFRIRREIQNTEMTFPPTNPIARERIEIENKMRHEYYERN